MKKILLLVGIFLLVSFYLFSRQVKRGFLKNVDFAVTVKLQEKIDTSSRLRLASVIGNVMEGATFFASPAFSVIAVGGITLLALIDRKNKKIRLRALIIPILFGLIVVGELYGKSVVHHPAPPFFMIENPTSFFPKYYINEQYSYPSGHAARAVFLGISILSLVACHMAQKFQKWMVTIAIFAYIGIVCISRIYLGHHWFSDIIGGMLLGLATALLAQSVLEQYGRN